MNKQEAFENMVITETDLSINCENHINLDELEYGYNTLGDIFKQDEHVFSNRVKLISFINYKFSLLTNTQKQIAEYRFYYKYTIKQIAKVLDKAESTICEHLKNIEKIW